MTLFLAGFFVGSSLTYGYLRWACERAVERLQKAMQDELNHP